jgi:hypothetical protein
MIDAGGSVSRPASPQFAAKLATGVSLQERQTLERIAERKRVKVAAVVRWAIEEYIANHAEPSRDGSPVLAAS